MSTKSPQPLYEWARYFQGINTMHVRLPLDLDVPEVTAALEKFRTYDMALRTARERVDAAEKGIDQGATADHFANIAAVEADPEAAASDPITEGLDAATAELSNAKAMLTATDEAMEKAYRQLQGAVRNAAPELSERLRGSIEKNRMVIADKAYAIEIATQALENDLGILDMLDSITSGSGLVEDEHPAIRPVTSLEPLKASTQAIGSAVTVIGARIGATS